MIGEDVDAGVRHRLERADRATELFTGFGWATLVSRHQPMPPAASAAVASSNEARTASSTGCAAPGVPRRVPGAPSRETVATRRVRSRPRTASARTPLASAGTRNNDRSGPVPAGTRSRSATWPDRTNQRVSQEPPPVAVWSGLDRVNGGRPPAGLIGRGHRADDFTLADLRQPLGLGVTVAGSEQRHGEQVGAQKRPRVERSSMVATSLLHCERDRPRTRCAIVFLRTSSVPPPSR